MIAPRRCAGFTVVELMVGVALVAIILVYAVPSFSVAMQNRQIRTAAESIQNGLIAARTEALRRNRPVKFSMTGSTGWQVGCETPVATVDADGLEECPAVLQTRSAQESSVNAVLTTGETVASSGAAAASPIFDGSITFTQLGRVSSTSVSPGNLANYRLTNPAGGACAAGGGEMRCLSVVVSVGGLVRMCDPALVSPDPRAC